MEQINWSQDLSKRITLNSPHCDSPETSILISIFLKLWMFSKAGQSSAQIPLLSICQERKYKHNLFLKQAIDIICQGSFEEFLSHVNSITQYCDLFQDIGLCKKSMTKTAKINIISKNLQLMIIIQERNLPAKKFYCGYIENPWVVHIAVETFKYYPAIHKEENLFIATPNNNLERFPFKFTPDMHRENQKSIQEKITKIMDLLEGSIEFLKPELKTNLIDFLKSNKIVGVDEKKIEKFKKILNDGRNCSNHQKVIFDCGNIHCAQCFGNNTICRCGVRFDPEKIRQVKTVTNPTLTYYQPIPQKINLPPAHGPSQSSPQVNYQQSNLIHNYQQSNPIQNYQQSNPIQNYQQSNPIQHYPQSNPIQNIPTFHDQVVECWVCGNKIYASQSIVCFKAHYMCNNCHQYSNNRCSQCEELVCVYCRSYIMAADLVFHSNCYYHTNCAIYLGI
jgi:hypothetical protein